MDILKIETKFTKMIISKIISRMLKKKCGYDIKVDLATFDVSMIDGDAYVKIGGDLVIKKDTVTKITDEIF